jgi:hypothetical protein
VTPLLGGSLVLDVAVILVLVLLVVLPAAGGRPRVSSLLLLFFGLPRRLFLFTKEKRTDCSLFFFTGDLSGDFGGLIGLIQRTIYEESNLFDLIENLVP